LIECGYEKQKQERIDMTTKQDVIKKAKIQTKPNTTAGIRMNGDEKQEIQATAKKMGLNFTELLVGCYRYLKNKL